MPQFEVFIPSATADGFDVTARLKAQSWTEALRNGLARLGDTADVRHVMCDIREDGIDVTEPKSGRVFKIRELGESEAAGIAAGAVSTGAGTAPTAPPPATAAAPIAVPRQEEPKAAPVPVVHPDDPTQPRARRPVKADKVVAPKPAPELASAVEALGERRVAAAPREPAFGRGKESATRTIDDLLGDMFMAVGNLYEHKTLKAAADYVLDLAMKAVPSESGSVFVSSINSNDLYFAAARGPKAEEVMSFRVPMGQGIVGLAAQEGVAIAVSDAERDPRFFAGISKRVGYATRSVACSPAQRDGRVYGALQLINKRDGATFTADEMSILDYLAGQFAEYVINTGQTDA